MLLVDDLGLLESTRYLLVQAEAACCACLMKAMPRVRDSQVLQLTCIVQPHHQDADLFFSSLDLPDDGEQTHAARGSRSILPGIKPSTDPI